MHEFSYAYRYFRSCSVWLTNHRGMYIRDYSAFTRVGQNTHGTELVSRGQTTFCFCNGCGKAAPNIKGKNSTQYKRKRSPTQYIAKKGKIGLYIVAIVTRNYSFA